MYWNDLDLSSRSKLMELYLRNGITSLTAMKEHYNSLQDGGKLTFKQWKEKMQQKYPDIEMDNNKAGYDYETYFNDNYNEAVAQLNNLRHFPDTYKLYNHPTFSNESIYSRGPMIGGSWGYAHPWDTQWSNTEGFTPSIVNRQIHPEIYKEDRPYTEDEIYSHRFGPGGPITKIIKDAAQKVIAARQKVNSNFSKVDLSVPITQGYGTTSESSSTNVNRIPVQQIELAPKGWTAERIKLENDARQYERNHTTPQLRASDIPAPRNQEEAEAYERARQWRVEQQRRLEEDAKAAKAGEKGAEFLASSLPYFVPYVGQALAAKDMSDALYEGNNEEAALMMGLMSLPIISKGFKFKKHPQNVISSNMDINLKQPLKSIDDMSLEELEEAYTRALDDNSYNLQNIIDRYSELKWEKHSGKPNAISKYLKETYSKPLDNSPSITTLYHGSPTIFQSFDLNLSDGVAYFSPLKRYAAGYGNNIKPSKIFATELEMPDVWEGNFKIMNQPNLAANKYYGDLEFLVGNSKHIKNANPLSFNAEGNLIPLKERFNFDLDNWSYKNGGKLNGRQN